MKAVLVLWFIASLILIYIDDRGHRWDGLSKIFFWVAVAATLIWGSQTYNPNLTHSIATIEINPSWNTAIIAGIIISICITGPIALIHIIYDNIKYKGD